MKGALLTDTHFFNWKTFQGSEESIAKNGISKRLLEQKTTVLQAVRIANERKVDFFAHAGDWIHSVGYSQNEALNVAKSIVEEMKAPLLSADGNHDTPIRINPKSANLITNIIRTFSYEPLESYKGIKIVNYYDAVDYDAIKGYKAVILHKTPLGALTGNYTFDEGVDWKTLAKNNDLVFFGHIHQRQQLGENCYVIGSPYHLNFGDVGDRGFYIVDFDTKEVEFIKLDYPEFITVAHPAQVVPNDGNYYRVLHSKEKVEGENVVSVVIPEFFEERIKTSDFNSILNEWLKLNGKDTTYLEMIKEIISEKLVLTRDVFKGRLVEVEIKDFISVGQVKYKVEDGFTLITGDSEGFSSNGSGKSTIAGESILWCLFGETTKGLTGDDVIRRGQKDCCVTLTLVDKKGMYLIKRSRKNGLEIILPDEENITQGARQADRQETLERQILGFTKLVFQASCYFSQENLLMLTGLSDTEKTSMITDLLGFEAYDDLYEKVCAKVKSFENDIAKNQTELVSLDREMAVNRNSFDMTTNQIKELEDKIDSDVDRVGELRKVEGIDKDYAAEEKKLADEELEYHNVLDRMEEKLEVIDEERRDLEHAQSELSFKTKSLKNQVPVLNKEIEQLNTLRYGEKCDKCGAVITQQSADVFILEKEGKITDCVREIVELDKQTADITSKIDDINKKGAEFVSKKIIATNSINMIRASSKKLADEKEQLTKTTVALNMYITQIEGNQKRLRVLKDKIEQCMSDYTGIETAIKEANWKIKVVNRSLEILDFWRIAFSTKGIRSVLLDKFCNEINSFVNQCLSSISSGNMSVIVRPTKTTKSGEERNKIGIDVLLDTQVVKYESLSGGEKRRVDISLIFGLNYWITSMFGLKTSLLGIMVLDEVLGGLDASGFETVANLLYNEGKTKAVVVIDHSTDLGSYTNKIWTVVKRNGISQLNQ